MKDQNRNTFFNKFIRGKSKFTQSMEFFDTISKVPVDLLESVIHYLKNADAKNVSIAQLQKHYSILLNQLLIMPTAPFYQFYYRARVTTENNLKELKNPPHEVVNVMGRCNDIGESLFYCSNCYVTSILEIRPKINDVVTVLCVETHSKEHRINPWAILIPLAKNLTQDNMIQYSIKHSDKRIQSKLDMIEELFESTMVIDVIPGNEWMYKPSNALTKAVFDRQKQNNNIGIAYPSKITRFRGVNFAIHSNWLNLHKTPKYSAFRVAITDNKENGNFRGKIIEMANEMDSKENFLFKKYTGPNEWLELNELFYNRYDAIFKHEQEQRNLEHNFFRKIYPPPYYWDTRFDD